MNPTDPNDQAMQPPVGMAPASTSMGKEGEVVPVPVSEPIHTSTEHEIPKEVASHVQVTYEKPDIPPDLAQIGITAAPADQTVAPISQTQQTSLPLTDDQIGEGLGQKPTTSFRWLAEWCVKQLLRMHMHLKNVQGHFIRVKDM